MSQKSVRSILFANRTRVVPVLLAALISAALPARAQDLLVKWQDGPTSAAAEEAHTRIGSTVKRNFLALGWQVVRLPDGMSVTEGLHSYRQARGVLAVEPDSAVPPRPLPQSPRSEPIPEATGTVGRHSSGNFDVTQGLIPNDPRFLEQWYLRKIAATNAWSVTTGSADVVVAVLDSGVNYRHPDLLPNLWRNPGETGQDTQGRDKATNGVDDDTNGYIDDVFGADVKAGTGDPWDTGYGSSADPIYHGTLIAGIIGAAGNNGVGISGINWTVRVMSVRWGVNDDYDVQATPTTYWSGNLAAWDYVLTMKRRGVNIRVSSHSYGNPGIEPAAVLDAIRQAGEAGILNVFAAGNATGNLDLIPSTMAQPDPSVLVVGGSTETDGLASFSNYGRSTVHLAAPATGILSTSGGGYAALDGTSFAAPLVAGAAALLLASNPDLTRDELKAALLGSVDQPAALKGKFITSGRLNVARALARLAETNAPALVVNAAPNSPKTPANAVIRFRFSRPMNLASVEQALSITPAVSGTFEASPDLQTYSFRPTAPLTGTNTFTVRISSAVLDESGETLDGNFNGEREGAGLDDFVWSFKLPYPHDDFATPRLLSGPTGVEESQSKHTTLELGEPSHVTNDPLKVGGSVWYQWTAPDTGGWFTFDLTGLMRFDSLLAVYLGDRLDQLVPVAGGDNYGASLSSRVSFFAEPGKTYPVAVANKGDLFFTPNIGGPFKLTWYPTPQPGFTGNQLSALDGLPGTRISIFGTNFSGVTAVLFNGAASVFTNTNPDQVDLRLVATVPPDARSGPVTLVTPHGTAITTVLFSVTTPPLKIRTTENGQALVFWASTSPEFVLETADQLATGIWRTAPGQPESQDGTSMLLLPLNSASQFLRLRKVTE